MSHKRSIAQPSPDAPKEQLVHWVRYGDTDKVEGVVKKHREKSLGWNFDPNHFDKYGRSLVMLASKRGFLDILKLLIEEKANLEFRDNNDNKAIHYAAMGGHRECCEALIQAGAQLCDENKFGRRVDVLAKKNGHLELGQFLIDSGCYRDVEEDSEEEPPELKEGQEEPPALPAQQKQLLKKGRTLGLRLDTAADIPKPGEGELLIRIHAVPLDPRDGEVYGWVEEAPEESFRVGKGGAAGVVVGLGGGEVPETFQIGTKVVIRQTDQDGNGVMASYITVPAENVYRVTAQLDMDTAALLPALSIAQRNMKAVICPLNKEAFQKAPILVTGCGATGLLTIALAKKLGSPKILAADSTPVQLELAKKLGAEAIDATDLGILKQKVLAASENQGVGFWVDTSGRVDLLEAGLGMVRVGGRVAWSASPRHPLTLDNPAEDLFQRCLTLKTIAGPAPWRIWEEAEKLLEEDKDEILQSVRTHEIPLTHFQDAYALLLSGMGGQVVVQTQH